MATGTFDSIPTALTAQALANNFSKEEKARRENALINKHFYYDRQKGYVDLFNTEVTPVTVNLTHPIVRRRASLLYGRKLMREVKGTAASVSYLEQVWEKNDIDSFLLRVDLLAELTGSALVSPVWDEEDEVVKLMTWDGSQVSVVADEDDPDKAAAVSLVKLVDRLHDSWSKGNPQNERVVKQQIWTAEGVVTYEGSTNTQSEENPVGFLPFVNFKGEEVWGSYIGHAPAESVRNLNQCINQLWTDLGYTIKMQGAVPIVLTGYESGEGITLQPGRAISLPAGASAAALNLSPKIQESLEVIQELEEKIYETSSVPKISVVGGEGNSGRELLVRWYPLIDVFHEKSVRFSAYELELANTILRFADMDPIDSLKVHYPEDDVLPLSPLEDSLEQDIILGIRSPLDEIMRRKPGLDREDALAEGLENREDSVLMGVIQPGVTSDRAPEGV